MFANPYEKGNAQGTIMKWANLFTKSKLAWCLLELKMYNLKQEDENPLSSKSTHQAVPTA